VVHYLVAWGFVVLGLSYAVVCVLNLLGLARGRLRNGRSERMPTLASALMGIGLAGFFWSPGPPDASPATWHFYWLGVGAAGVVLLVVSCIRRWRSDRRSSAKGDALFFLRAYTDLHDWRPRHFVLLAAFAASPLLASLMPDNWWQLVGSAPQP
jgi:hypothetical protein